MAYQQNFKDDDEKQGQSGQQGQTIAGQSSVSSQQGGAAPTGGSNNKPTSSGSWTNLQNYVSANSGADAAMGNKIKAGIETRANDATQSGQQYQQRANSQIEAGTVRDDGIINQVSADPDSIRKNDWSYSNSNSNPSSSTIHGSSTASDISGILSGLSNQNNPEGRASEEFTRRDQFDKQWDAYYGGPTDANKVEGYQDVSQQYNTVDSRAQNAQTHEGRKTLLNDEYARPDYTQGQKDLDSFILGAGDQGKQVLNDINQNYSGFSQGWDDIVSQTNQGIKEGDAITEATRTGTRNATNTNLQNYNDTFTGYTNDLAAEAADWDNRYSDMTSGNNYSAAGMDNDVAKWLGSQGVNPWDFASRNQNRGLGDMASAEEIAQYDALNDLGRVEGAQYQDFTPTGLGADDFFKLDNKGYGAGERAHSIYTGAQQKAESGNRDRAQQYNDVISAFSTGGIAGGGKGMSTADALADLGVSEDVYQRGLAAGVNILDFVKPNDQTYDVGDFASDADRKEWVGLISQLTGFDLGQNALFDSGNKGMKGYTFDKKGYEALMVPVEIASNGQMSGRTPSSGGFGEQTRRNIENSALGQTAANADPTSRFR